MTNLTPRRLLAALAVVTLASAGAVADIATVSTSDGQQMTYEYKGEDLRINTGDGSDTYMLLVDGTVYSVTRSEGDYMVIDISQAMSMFGSTLQQAMPNAADAQVESLEATGRKQTVAGIEGEVYLVTYFDESGERQQSEMVLSEDPRALRFRDAVYAMAKSVTRSLGEEVDPKALQQQLLQRDMGILSYGSDMTITAIEAKDVAESRFVLPAAPTAMSGLGGLMGAFGGNAGDDNNKTARDTAADEEGAAPSMDELGKAFGKLFEN